MFTKAWDVLLLFLIPAGGGIPAGILLAKKLGFDGLGTTAIYAVSDVIAACAYEVLLLAFLAASQNRPFFMRLRIAFRMASEKLTAKYGLHPGPISLILISFGTEPMTGRIATKAAGYGFFTGWALTLTGDMFYFLLILISTLWLNHILGNGTLAVIIVMIAMFGGHFLIQWARGKFKKTYGTNDITK